MNEIGKYWKNYLKQFYIKEINPPPYLFFVLFIMVQLQLEIQNYAAYVLFGIGLIFMIIFNPILNSGINSLVYINMALGLIASNQKWKLFLMLFIIGGFLKGFYYQSKQQYVMMASFFISTIAYRTMPFKNCKDNQVYFIGFSTIFSYYLFRISVIAITGQNLIHLRIIVIPLLIITFEAIFIKKIEYLKNVSFIQLKSPQIKFHTIQIRKQVLNNKKDSLKYIFNHKFLCQDPQCFCKEINIKQFGQEIKSIQQKFVNYMYKQALDNLNKRDNQFLYNQYIKQLLNQKRLIQAMLLIKFLPNQIQNINIFRWVERQRNLQLIEKLIVQIEKNQKFTLSYHQYFEYDKNYSELVIKIGQIIYNKILLLNQIKKQQPYMNTLSEIGCNNVDNVQNLHLFYLNKIQKIQKDTGNFIGTIKYSLYLIGATNYRDQGKFLITDIKKHTQQSISFKKSDYQKLVFQVQMKSSNTQNGMNYQREYQKQIKNASFSVINSNVSFQKYFNVKRSFYGKFDINQTIPNIYIAKHHQSIISIFDKNSPQKQSQFIGLMRKIPLKISQTMNINVEFGVKIRMSQKNSVVLVCQFKIPNIANQCIITDLNGFNLKDIMEENSKWAFLKNQKITQTLNKMKQTRNEEKIIKKEQLFLDVKSNNYIQRINVIIQSPFQHLYKKEKNLLPIHIQYKKYSKNQEIKERNTRKRLTYIKQIQNYQQKEIQQAQSVSSSHNSKQFTVAIIKNFSDNNQVSFFSKMKSIFIGILLLSIILVTIQNFAFNLPWDNTQNQFNPIQDITSLFFIQKNIYQVVGFAQDYITMISTNKLDDQIDIPLAYTFSNFQAQTALNPQKLTIYQNLKYQIEYRLNRVCPIFQQITYKMLNTIIFVQSQKQQGMTQQLKIKNILMNYIVDIFLLIKLKPYKSSLINLSYHFGVQPILKNLAQQQLNILNQILSTNKMQNIILNAFFIIFLILMIIPLILINKKKAKLSQNIFDILVTVKCQQINKQILKLNQVRQIILSKYQSQNQKQINLKRVSNQSNQLGKNQQFVEPLKLQKANSFKIGQTVFYRSQFNVKQQQKFIGNIKINPDRRRPAQLNVTLTYKQKTYSFLKSLSPFLIMLFFLDSIVQISYLKLHQTINIQTSINDIFKKQTTLITQSILLINTKMMIDNGSSLIYLNKTLDVWVNQSLYEINKNYLFNEYTSQLDKCKNFYQICLRQFSETILAGIIQQAVRKAYNAFITKDPNLYQIRRGLVYAQAVVQAKYNITKQKINNQKQILRQQSIKDINFKNEFYVKICILTIVFLTLSIFWVQRAKQQYIREVKIITFLNNEMISQSKRIDSFLIKLAKTSNK